MKTEQHQIFYPSFIIGGAAKSGTTSLSRYLDQLPGIFIPNREPNFYTYIGEKPEYQIKNHSFIDNIDDYSRLLTPPGDPNEQVLIGEKSVSYLYKDYYKQVINNVKKYHPHWEAIKWIFILRHPVQRAYSQYVHNLNFHEKLSFRDAIKSWPDRKGAGWIPAYDYLGAGFYTEAIQEYMHHFKQVRIYLFEDLLHRPNWLINDILEFINVKASPKEILFDKYNISGVPKNKFFKSGLSLLQKNAFIKWMADNVPPDVRQRSKKKVRKFLYQKPPLPSDDEHEICFHYKAEIVKLEKLINRKLTDWYCEEMKYEIKNS